MGALRLQICQQEVARLRSLLVQREGEISHMAAERAELRRALGREEAAAVAAAPQYAACSDSDIACGAQHPIDDLSRTVSAASTPVTDTTSATIINEASARAAPLWNGKLQSQSTERRAPGRVQTSTETLELQDL